MTTVIVLAGTFVLCNLLMVAMCGANRHAARCTCHRVVEKQK